jgi:hypothetical protein
MSENSTGRRRLTRQTHFANYVPGWIRSASAQPYLACLAPATADLPNPRLPIRSPSLISPHHHQPYPLSPRRPRQIPPYLPLHHSPLPLSRPPQHRRMIRIHNLRLRTVVPRTAAVGATNLARRVIRAARAAHRIFTLEVYRRAVDTSDPALGVGQAEALVV